MKTILVVILVLVVTILLYAATRPGTLVVQRSITIQATPEKIYPMINDFHQWQVWSPWQKLDPAMQVSFSGPDRGKGAVYTWEGNKKVGQGRMEITDSAPSNHVTIKLDFIKPFEGHNVTEFTLEPEGDTTSVKWMMQGKNNYLAKLMGVFFNMDKAIGKDFETGLNNLKAASEK
ncbi:SRPBCC family protein [Edaphobacter bradus]|uniref:SRPBCC family protein n=1 Tax=Edaphobacter bradus TaxID=2259016 RepID=UPI0021DF9084|nr:SRPBCC family protein [Edaphobacter bradus]